MLISSSTPLASVNTDSVLQLYFRGSRQHFFQASELVYLQGDGNYTWLHWTNRPSMIMPKTLKQLGSLLPSERFVRVHRNSIVNWQYVERLERLKSGLGVIYLVGGNALPISRRRWEVIYEALQNT